MLSDNELALRSSMQEVFMDPYEPDEIFWYSTYSENWLLKGDNNTGTFME
jgi:hypothetical protein